MVHAEVDDRLLHLLDSGGQGPPVVLCHPVGAQASAFDPLIDHVPDVYRLIRWDRRGHGASDPGSPHADASARDLFGLMDLIGVERAVLGAVDEGCLVVIEAALHQPDRVRALALLNAPPVADDPRLGPRVQELAMPVLLLRGIADGDDTEPDRRFCAQVSDCRGVVSLDEAGTDAHLSHPRQVAVLLRRFLEELPA